MYIFKGKKKPHWKEPTPTCYPQWRRCWTRSRREHLRSLSADPEKWRVRAWRCWRTSRFPCIRQWTLTALDSNMTFTSPSTTGAFCRLMTAALLPTSGKTFYNSRKWVKHPLNRWVSELAPVRDSPCSSPVWHTPREISAPSSKWFSPSGRCRPLCPHLRKQQKRWRGIKLGSIWFSGIHLLWSGYGCFWSRVF